MNDNTDYDEGDHIDENRKESLNTDIEVLKLGKLSQQKNIENIQKKMMKEIVWM